MRQFVLTRKKWIVATVVMGLLGGLGSVVMTADEAEAQAQSTPAISGARADGEEASLSLVISVSQSGEGERFQRTRLTYRAFTGVDFTFFEGEIPNKDFKVTANGMTLNTDTTGLPHFGGNGGPISLTWTKNGVLRCM